jgi:hypothetical protein
VTDPTPEPRERNRLLRAFRQDFNLIGLGGAAALSALLANPLPLALGLAAEAFYLIYAPDSVWFKRLVAGEETQRRRAARDLARRRLLDRMPREDRAKFFAVRAVVDGAAESLDADSRLLLEAELARLEDLLDEFAELLVAHQEGARYLRGQNLQEIQRAAERAREDAEGMTDLNLRQAVESRRNVLAQRWETLQSLVRDLRIVRTQIDTIEHALRLFADKAAAWTAAGRSTETLRELVTGLEGTEAALREVRPVLQRLERTLHAREGVRD